MRIAFSQKPFVEAPKEYLRVRLVEGGKTRLVVREGIETLEVATKKRKDITRRRFIVLCRSIIQTGKQHKAKKVALELEQLSFPQLKSVPLHKLASIIAQAFEMANFEYTAYKSMPPEGWNTVEEVLVCGKVPKNVQDGFARGQIIAGEVNACRMLANTPGGDMTPKLLAGAAKEAIANTRATIKILGRKEMQEEGMGAVLGIAQGSSEEPQFIVLEYKGAPKTKKPVLLIGKGVTFDTGGLQVKPGDSMYEMHMDMSGGAAVIHAVALAAKLEIRANIVGLIPAVENSPSGSAVRPGDILKSLSGRTIEILHTDAEGRVILADAITYAKRYDPKLVVDVATLTGAVFVALGTQASAFMTNREALIPKLQELGEETGDYLWPFPAWEEYEAMTKGIFGDVPNISTDGNSRYGGVIAGGMFLREFAKDLSCPWVHIDMASRTTADKNECLSKGAAGAPVRLLFGIIEEYAR
jgi:leucyl aminopeptidase